MSWKKIRIILPVALLCVCLAGYLLVQNRDAGYTVEVYKVDNNGYGYKIVQDERPFIIQPFIPGIAGKQSFQTPDDAHRVGKLVRKRLESGQVPSVTPEDLSRLKIRY